MHVEPCGTDRALPIVGFWGVCFGAAATRPPAAVSSGTLFIPERKVKERGQGRVQGVCAFVFLQFESIGTAAAPVRRFSSSGRATGVCCRGLTAV